jgi:myosin-crossreactive antigen
MNTIKDEASFKLNKKHTHTIICLKYCGGENLKTRTHFIPEYLAFDFFDTKFYSSSYLKYEKLSIM